MECQPGWTEHCPPTVAGGETVTKSMFSNHPELSALFCYNDLVAIGALRNCATSGRRVPDDVAIVGYDGISMSALVSPSLTTCYVPREDIGSQAASMLLNCINDAGSSCGTTIFTPELIIRESTLGVDTAVITQ